MAYEGDSGQADSSPLQPLARAAATIGSGAVAGMAVGVVRMKMLAALLGPAGLGVFAQLSGLQNLIAGVIPAGMQVGAVRFIARYRNDRSGVLGSFMTTARLLFLSTSLAAVAACVLFLSPLTRWTMGSVDFRGLVLISVIGVPFLVQTQLWLAFIQSGLNSRAVAASTLLPSLAALPLVVMLVWRYQQQGAALSLVIGAIISYAFAWFVARRTTDDTSWRLATTGSLDHRHLPYMAKFVGVSFPLLAMNLFVPFLARIFIVRDVGYKANGIYQAVLALSLQYMAVPLGAITTYSFPRISQLSRMDDINREVNAAFRLGILATGAGALLMITFRDVLLAVLFSAAFLPGIALLAWQLLGDVFKAGAYTLQLPLLPQSRFLAKAVLSILQYGAFLAVFLAAPPRSRVAAAVAAHVASWGLCFVSHYFYVRRVNRFRLGRANVLLFLETCVAVLVVSFLPCASLPARCLSLGVALAWASIALSRGDRLALRGAVCGLAPWFHRVKRHSSRTGGDD